LRDLYEEICAINETSGSDFSLYLEIITYGNPKAFCDSLVSSKYIIIHQNMPLAERLDHLRTSFACFLPYSFLPVEKTMVSTSFSCKLIEYYEAGRPILVYGPEYASIPRYFSNAGLPLCATCRPQLRSALRSISEHDTPDLLSRYAEVWKRFHSPQAITDRLFNRI